MHTDMCEVDFIEQNLLPGDGHRVGRQDSNSNNFLLDMLLLFS